LLDHVGTWYFRMSDFFMYTC